MELKRLRPVAGTVSTAAEGIHYRNTGNAEEQPLTWSNPQGKAAKWLARNAILWVGITII